MQPLHRDTPFSLPIKFIQFGEGNFLRAYIDWQIDLLNERVGLNAGVVVVRPRGHTAKPLLDVQDGLFTTLIQGIDEKGGAVRQYRKISCVQREINAVTMYDDFLALARNPDTRFVVSNTTEAGIVTNDTDALTDAPPLSFPAKLTQLMFERFRHFDGAQDKGWVILPCELIDHNGPALKAAVLHFAVLWKLDSQFITWLEQANTFCSTLVDRIVSGFPESQIADIETELGYKDQFLVAAEYYYVFIIQGPAWLADELRLADANLNIKLVDDIAPYKQMKVGILNGGHTTLVPVALLAGLTSVSKAVNHPTIGDFLIAALDNEIIPALPLPHDEMVQFAADVLRRFRNPSIHHKLESIALNSWPKFAARVMPQIQSFHAITGKLPQRLVLALAATLLLYRGDVVILSDDAATLTWFQDAWSRVKTGQDTTRDLVGQWLANTSLWNSDLNQIDGLTNAVVSALASIERDGILATINAINVVN
ncbi:tagaturonate reductase [Glaciimonas sp. CA11.2]|uniref:tagaturonate reductase n=1 Tax=Glaciimonas sp. CA11.2 TaxID=3048601 RepID=UPI002AB331D8|nr:tagaturonate reductase [Glaciimonas sp. CA11.2]MDY7545168.1 tagaturonate reductase [Glaciimonas sp. CA11.2]MEB0162303.1 tagaturonate reductase [Glaciimonas sp. CA11.2]